MRYVMIIPLLLISIGGIAEPLPSDSEGTPEAFWHLLAGAGSSHPGWGDTKEKVDTLDLLLRYERQETRLRGKSWYLNRRSLVIEPAIHLLSSPSEPPMFGVYFQSLWTFVADSAVQPYLFAGGGPVYTLAEIPGTSSRLRGSYQAGAGVHYRIGGTVISLETRFHHLSNGGIEEPNDPLNSAKLLLGIRLSNY